MIQSHFARKGFLFLLIVGLSAVPAACGAGADEVVVDSKQSSANTVSVWDEAATATISQPAAASGTSAERQPIYSVDLATVHVAMYDSAAAIAGSYAPLYVKPKSKAQGASMDAALTAAAYGVLRGLFPSRSAVYQPVYDAQLAKLPDDEARRLGLALGAEVAGGVLAARTADGRDVALAPFVAGTGPGEFRGPALVGRSMPSIKPFTLSSAAQFRPAGRPGLQTAAYAADLNETRLLGGAQSSTRTDEQATSARFHTENPGLFWPRNLRVFLTSGGRSLAETARLGALLWTTHADASIACFEAKYHHLSWRPFSAINLADTDGNDATTADPAWTPFLPTPPHPEYPAAHACVAAAAAQVLTVFFGTPNVAFDFDSTASATSHHYENTDALLADVTTARIAGGMHFRSALVDGAALGRSVANWAASQAFKPR